jgi:hypothetical protein
MHGEIRLRRWLPFTAEQVIAPDRGMIWNATVRINGLPIYGFDPLIEGKGEMRWKLLRFIPVNTAAGPDITRSGAGRVIAELVWLPSALCRSDVAWTAEDALHATARVNVSGESRDLELTIGDNGRLEAIRMDRWANLDGRRFDYHRFGGVVQDEHVCGNYTIPTRLRIGRYFGGDRFERDGEFFRVTVDQAEFR